MSLTEKVAKFAKIRIEVEGNPVPKQSTRFVSANGRVGAYAPARVKAWQELVGLRGKEAMAGRPPIDGKIRVSICLFVERDNSDLDNLTKGILDGLQGVVYLNDKQVVELRVRKVHVGKGDGNAYIVIEEL